jgi:hypothetical protein
MKESSQQQQECCERKRRRGERRQRRSSSLLRTATLLLLFLLGSALGNRIAPSASRVSSSRRIVSKHEILIISSSLLRGGATVAPLTPTKKSIHKTAGGRSAGNEKAQERSNNDEKQEHFPLSKIDWGVFGIYFCTAVTMTLPVLIVPMMDAEIMAATDTTSSTTTATSLVAMVASMAPFGGGMGKMVNGFVCQQLGGPTSSKLYFMGSTMASLLYSSITLLPGEATATHTNFLTPHYLGWYIAAIEFFAAIQWTVCSLFLSIYYANNPALFARGVTILSLASTGGQIATKVLGAMVLQHVHWRYVARFSVIIALTGLIICSWTSRIMTQCNTAAQSFQSSSTAAAGTNKKSTISSPPSVRQAIQQVLGSPIFWMVGLAHVSGYATRTSDRVLGKFLQEVTSLSRK